jgi:hypothetical protein
MIKYFFFMGKNSKPIGEGNVEVLQKSMELLVNYVATNLSNKKV